MRKLLALLMVIAFLFTLGVSAEEAAAKPGADGKGIYLSTCDSEVGWNMELAAGAGKQGGYVQGEMKGAGDLVMMLQFPEMDISPYLSNGYLHFWLYTSDAGAIVDGQFELTSGKTADLNEMHWDGWSLSIPLENGWNQIKLKFSDAKFQGGEPNYTGINFMRFYLHCFDPVIVGIDEMYITTDAVGVPTRPEPAQTDPEDDKRLGSATAGISLLNGESAEGWVGAPVVAEVKEGGVDGKYLSVTTTAAGTPLFCTTFSPKLDISYYKDTGYLYFRLYVSNASLITGGQIELTSSGGADAKELTWENFSGLTNGWNEMRLKFSDATLTGGTINYTRADYFRIYLFASDAIEIGIDDMYITTDALGRPEPVVYTDETTAEGTDDTSGTAPVTGDVATVIAIVGVLTAAFGYYFVDKRLKRAFKA